MTSLISVGILMFLALVVSNVNAICCGRGKHGFCNDCKTTSLFGHRKCCGEGSGHGKGCNIFCCNCAGHCRKGSPIIHFLSGWFLSKKYSCKQHHEYTEEKEPKDMIKLKDTWDAFNKIDLDHDNTISPDEFTEAIMLRLKDHEEAPILASQLLNSEDEEEVATLLDQVNESEEMDESFIHMLVDEFMEMDENNDGEIQASEFDKDLK